MPFVVSDQLPAEIIARALTDNDFKNELIKDPTKILTDFGYETDGYEYQVFEDTKELRHFIEPNSPINNSHVATISKQIRKLLYRNFIPHCGDGNSQFSIPEDKFCYQYNTQVRIECTSLPTCQ